MVYFYSGVDIYDRVVLGVVFFAVCCCAIGFPWYVIELCRVGERVRGHNDELAVNLARDVKIMTT